MSLTFSLYARWKAAKGHTSDRKALAELGVSHGAAVHWKAGRNADAHVIEQMAKDLGDDPAPLIARVMQERSTGPDARTWGRMARRLGATAAVAVVVLTSPIGELRAAGHAITHDALYIMRSVSRYVRVQVASILSTFTTGRSYGTPALLA